jgi:cytochrome c-type biogenesis protein CcmH
MSARSVNRSLKGWPAWIVLIFAVVGLLAFGATRDTGPRTPDERIESISKRLACPVCSGESVYESRNPASNQIREAIKQAVADGDQTDDEIIAEIAVAYQGEELLVPTASGVEALAWALPATAFVIAVVGLSVAFRRWRAASAALGQATEDDYELVAAALAEQHRSEADPAGRSDPDAS